MINVTASSMPSLRRVATSDPQIIIAAAVARTLIAAALGFRPFDDTFITFRYALNLASGFGFVFNRGEPVLGTTTPLWTLILAGFRTLGLPIPETAFAVSLLADSVTAVLMLALLLRLQLPRHVAVGSVLLYLSIFDLLSISRSGMETSLFVLLVLATLHEVSADRFRTCFPLASLACLTRPEGLALLPTLLLALFRNRKMRISDLLAGLVLSAVLLGAWTVFSVAYFGSVAPQSVVAKAHHNAVDPSLAEFSRMNLLLFFAIGQFGGAVFERTWLQLNALLTALSAVAVVALGVRTWKERQGPSTRRLSVLTFFPLGYVVALSAAGAFTWFPWYYGPIYPFAAMLALIGLDEIGKLLSRRTRFGRWVFPLGTATLICGQVAAGVTVKLRSDRDFVVEGYARSAAVVPEGDGERVAAFEIGAIGWEVWPLTVIDLAGLVTPVATEASAEAIVRLEQPEYLCLRTDDAAAFLAVVSRSGWFAERYEQIYAFPDPFASREFVVYGRREAGPAANRGISR